MCKVVASLDREEDFCFRIKRPSPASQKNPKPRLLGEADEIPWAGALVEVGSLKRHENPTRDQGDREGTGGREGLVVSRHRYI